MSSGPQNVSVSATDDFLSSSILSVSYAKFCTRLGNSIFATEPEALTDMSRYLDVKAPQDYCFPDGAHDHMKQVLWATLRCKEWESQEQLGHTAKALLDGLKPGDPVYVFTAYHQQRDSAADRGAAQRGIFIVSTVPLPAAMHEVAKHVIYPILDAVPLAEDAVHVLLVRALYKALRETFVVKTGRATGRRQSPAVDSDHHPTVSLTRFREEVRSNFEETANGVLLAAFDAAMCDQRLLHFEFTAQRQEPVTDPHFAERARFLSSSPRGTQQQAAQQQQQGRDGDEGDEDLDLIDVRRCVPLPVPLSSATPAQQLAHGSSIKYLVTAFRQTIAKLYWCFLTRIPLLFVGDSAADVSCAARACVHLAAPIPIDASRIAPFCTLEHVDFFIKNMSASPFIALGATNAFVMHREFPGVAKCNLVDGSIAVDKAAFRLLPSSIQQELDDIVKAAKDPVIPECYIRARLLLLNRRVLEAMHQQTGPLYAVIGRVPNIVEMPLLNMSTAVESETEVPNNVEEERRRTTESPEQTAAAAASGLEGGSAQALGDEARTDSSFVMVEGESSKCDANTASNPSSPAHDAWIARVLQRTADIPAAVSMYEQLSKKNCEIITSTDAWYKDMMKYLRTIAEQSEPHHQHMYEELKTFSVHDEAHHDASLMFCASDPHGALQQQGRLDRIHRLRVVQDYRERVYLLLDSLAKNNSRGLLRKINRHMSDFFDFPGPAMAYNMHTQLLLHSTECKVEMYANRLKTSTSGTMYVTKNFLLFEAGALTMRRRHQIFPLDLVACVAKDDTAIFSSSLKIMLAVPPAVDDEEYGADDRPLPVLLTVSHVKQPTGLFPLLHTLVQRHRQLSRCMGKLTGLHCVPERQSIGMEYMIAPLVIPVGLYSTVGQVFVDEVWENQRVYPVLGWSPRLLPADPPSFSDLSCCRALQMEDVPVPEGFEVVSEWRLAREARMADASLMGQLTDELLVQHSKHTTTTQSARDSTDQASSPRRPDDTDFLYNSTWTSLDTFRERPVLSSTVRRRLWVRFRRLQRPVELLANDGTKQTLSTNSSDYVESPRDISIAAPLEEIDDDKQLDDG